MNYTLYLILGAVIASFLAQRYGDERLADKYSASEEARALVVYHQAELRYHFANTGVSGVLPTQTVTGIKDGTIYSSCLSNKILATSYVSFNAPQAAGAVVSTAQALNAGDPNVGVSNGASIVTPDLRTITLPCPVPAGSPVILTQVTP